MQDAITQLIEVSFASTVVSASLLATLGYFISEQFASINVVAAYASNVFVCLLLAGLLLYGCTATVNTAARASLQPVQL